MGYKKKSRLAVTLIFLSLASFLGCREEAGVRVTNLSCEYLTEPKGIDVVFDPIGGSYFPRSLRILKKKGTLLAYGYQNAASGIDGHVVFDYFKIMFWNLLPTKPSAKFYVITSLRKKHPDWFKEDLKALFELLSEKKIKPVIGKVMKLEQAAEAHQLVENYEVEGKIVLTVNK